MKEKVKEELQVAIIVISFLVLFFIRIVILTIIDGEINFFDRLQYKDQVLSNIMICLFIVAYIFSLFKISASLSYKLVDRIFKNVNTK
tara:strand:- start:95346 stop:95609 length:264 start_codon:yes stop_codon:yes gene_type:complete